MTFETPEKMDQLGDVGTYTAGGQDAGFLLIPKKLG